MSLPEFSALPEHLHPPVQRDEEGNLRTLGVEIELSGLDVPQIAEIVASVLGGRIRRETEYSMKVQVPHLGQFRVEADLALLRKIGRDRAEGTGSVLRDAAESAAAAVVERVAPFEVVGPPLPYTELPVMDRVIEALRRHGGRGTSAGLLLALATQLNPRVPRLEAPSIHAHLRSFAMLDPWLRTRRGIDIARRATWWVDPYPDEYVRRLVDTESPPRMGDLIDEYLHFNPSRNRALDMLPLFAHLDEGRVRAAVEDPRVKSRPTFHYRLPDSRLDDPTWSVLHEWDYWLVVERLAADSETLDALAHRWRETHTDPSAGATGWVERCSALLGERSMSPAARM